jgi:hypothetical protein
LLILCEYDFYLPKNTCLIRVPQENSEIKKLQKVYKKLSELNFNGEKISLSTTTVRKEQLVLEE